MAFSPNEIFTFTWRIENFSMCPQIIIESPAFIVNALENIKCKVNLLLAGGLKKDSVLCYLHKIEDFENNFGLSFQFTLISSNPEMHVKTLIYDHDFKKETAWGVSKVCSRDALFETKNLFLTNDILTLNCHIWKTGIKHEDVHSVIDSRNTNCSDGKGSSNVNECCGFTRIKVESKSFLWPIEQFSKMRSEEKLIKTVTSAKKDEPTLELTFYLTESANGHFVQLEIRTVFNPKCLKIVFMGCRVKTVGAPKGIRYQGDGVHLFGGLKDIPWKFPQFINREKIIIDKYLYYTNDVLYLFCELAFSVNGETCSFVEDRCIHPIYPPRNLNVTCPTHFYDQLCKEQDFSDFTIRTTEKAFKVHKCILGTRSPVFKAMFQTGMQENELGVVNITDVDSDILHKMITFMYTDILDELNQRDVVGLYSAANKYLVQPLICRCRCIFMSNLSVCTASEILQLADEYQDEELLDVVRSFIHVNASEVFRSRPWNDFRQNNFVLASNTRIRILTEKFLDGM